jgi:hypothetical protein
MEELFSTWSVPRSYKLEVCSSVQLWDGGQTGMAWVRDAEESPLLEAVVRERVVNTQQAGKKLCGCCGDLWIVEIRGRIVIACSAESCV